MDILIEIDAGMAVDTLGVSRATQSYPLVRTSYPFSTGSVIWWPRDRLGEPMSLARRVLQAPARCPTRNVPGPCPRRLPLGVAIQKTRTTPPSAR